MSGNGNQVPNQRGPVSYPRASTPHRPVECYHSSSAAGTAYMPNSTGAGQSSTQPTLRVQPTPQPSAPPAPPQDLSKTAMGGHNYVSQSQTQPQSRAQYGNFPYRTPQHSTRPSTHLRQHQQPFIPGATATTGPVMYPVVFPQTINIQTYQQPRSSPQYYPYVSYIPGYTTPPGHTPQYYYAANSSQLPTSTPPATAPSRNNPTTLAGPQCTSTTPTAPTVTLPHQQPPTHLHQPMTGLRQVAPKRSHRVPIINPDTQQEVVTDSYSNDSNIVSDNSDRQTPQPEPIHSFAEEFNRRVNEVARQPSSSDSVTKTNFISKNVELPLSSTSNLQSQPNAINSTNSNNNKSEIFTLNKNISLGPDVAAEVSETPIVSAISDNPVIVPKMNTNVKQLQKNSDQSLIIDNSKNIPHIKQYKSKNVPHNEVLEKSDNINVINMKPMAMVNPVTTYTNNSVPTAIVAPIQVVNASSAPIFTPSTVPETSHVNHINTQPIQAHVTNVPQTQRARETRERFRSEEKERRGRENISFEKQNTPNACKTNGPTPLVISSVDSLPDAINFTTSQNNKFTSENFINNTGLPLNITELLESENQAKSNVDVIKNEKVTTESVTPTATELLSASIERVAKVNSNIEGTLSSPDSKDKSSVFEAQAKLTQSISSVLRAQQPDSKMKDINLNNKTADPDAANGNTTESIGETATEDINKNNKVMKNQKNSNKKSSNKTASNEELDVESLENGNDEMYKLDNEDELIKDETEYKTSADEKEEILAAPTVFVPKYKYTDDQWSPLNKSGRKCYDIGLLKQIKDDPLSKNKPDAPLLEACNVIRTTPMQEPLQFANISRNNDTLFFPFGKSSGVGARNTTPRDPKKDGRNITPSGRGSMKSSSTQGGSSAHKPVIHVHLRDEVKLTESDSAWRPTRLFRSDIVDDSELKTQELYKKFRGILNKLTPQKFDTLLDRVKSLEINTQKRLEGVIDLVFEKAIDEPNFSEAYAAMCNKLSKLKVPADNPSTPDQCVNFRALIIHKCQNQFETDKVDEQVLKLEKEITECTDLTKKKELQLILQEEHRRVRMRSVGNVRFIGELYKLKMLTVKIMEYCMKYLIDKLEEEKLECLCKLLTTIGEQVENESTNHLEPIIKKMQEIVDKRSNKISSRVRFMIQDVIELRKRKWVAKTVIDTQPKMMDQIQKEAEQQQRHIELMNANPMGGGFRREDGGRGKRGNDNRRQNSNTFMDNNWKTSRTNYPVDTSKLKAGSQKNLNNIKLAPQQFAWNQGSGTKATTQMTGSTNSMIGLIKNQYSVLENVQTDPTSLRGIAPVHNYHSKGASIERSTFNNSRGDFSSGGSGSRSGSMSIGPSTPSTRSTSVSAPSTPSVATDTSSTPQNTPVPQKPLPEGKIKSVKALIEFCIRGQDDSMVEEFKTFEPQYHAALIGEIFNITMDKPAKEIELLVKALLHLVSSGILSPDNLISGMKETFEFAPDLHIDIPKLYDYLGKFVAPQIEQKHITFEQIFRLCDVIILSNHGQLLLKAIFRELLDSMGPTFVKTKWNESGLQLNQWMSEDLVPKWIEDNKFEFMQGDIKPSEEVTNTLTPAETQSKLLQLMNGNESCDCIKGWAQDKFGKASNEDWFMKALIKAICEHALFGPEGRDTPHFNQERMNKYVNIINEFGENKLAREASYLVGIQQLIHRLEHPQGLSLQIFQYLNDQYLISFDGFIAWEKSEKELEGKGVMMKALTSFFTNLKEADNEDSGSED